MNRLAAIILSCLMVGFPLPSFAAMRKTRLITNHAPPFGAKLNPSHPLAQGLVGLWDMSEGGGSTLYDSLGSVYNFALTNYAWTVSPFGSALASNGSTTAGSVSAPAGTPLDVTGTQLSFGGWVYPTISGNYQMILMHSAGSADATRHYALFLHINGPTQLYIDINGSFLGPTLTIPWVANSWNHIFVTFDGTNVRCYVNGKLSNTTGLSITLTSFVGASMYIGRDVPNNNFTLSGRLGMVSVYKRTLSAADIQALYNQPFAMFQPQTQVFLDAGVTPIITSSGVSQFFKSRWYRSVLR